MNLRGLTQAKWVSVVATILFFAFVFVFAMVMYGLTSLPWGNWHATLNVGLLCAVLGAFYGTIASLDRESGMAYADRPFLRSLLCGALGSAAVLLIQTWPPQTFNTVGALVGLAVGTVLGWLGWAWAKYVDF